MLNFCEQSQFFLKSKLKEELVLFCTPTVLVHTLTSRTGKWVSYIFINHLMMSFKKNCYRLFARGKMKPHSFNLHFLLLMSQYFVCYFHFMLLVLIILFKPFLWNWNFFFNWKNVWFSKNSIYKQFSEHLSCKFDRNNYWNQNNFL